MAVIPSIEEEKINNNNNDNDNDRAIRRGKSTRGTKNVGNETEKEYSKMFPKVSPKLIKDLISRQMQFPNKLPVLR